MTFAAIASWSAAGLAGAVALGWFYGAAYTARVEARWPAEGRMIDTAAGPLHVVEAGEGPVVVLVHGASANSREVRSGLEAPLVAAGYRVLAYDRPGFGASPPLGADAETNRLAAHARVLAALIEAEGLERPIVLGHSYGGAVALRLALDHPDAAGGLVLVGPATHGDVGPVAWYNHVGATPLVGTLFNRIVIPVAGPVAAADGLDGSFSPQAAPEDHYEATGVGLVFRPRTFASNAADLARANRDLRAQQDRYGEIAIPVAVVSGEDDQTVYTSRHSERTAAALPDARLSVLPDVGHMPHHVAPDLIVEHVDAIRSVLNADVRAAGTGAG